MANNTKKLEEIAEVKVGTTEYEAYGNMGKKRREITGILATARNVSKYLMASRVIKPIAIAVSSVGFAFMIMLMTDAEIGSRTFWIAITIGLVIGAFFEFVATAFEPALSAKTHNSTTTFKRNFIVGVKIYAVVMHVVTAYSLPAYIVEQKANGLQDTNEIKALVAKSERLKSKLNGTTTDPRISILTSKIERLKDSLVAKRAEKTEELLVNSTSMFVAKRRDANKQINKINSEALSIENKIARAEKEQTDIMAQSGQGSERLEEQITTVEKEIAQLRTSATEDKKTDTGNTGMLVFVLAILFVLLELSGTVFSVLHDKEILEGVGEEIAMTEEVKSKLYSTKTAMKERNANIKAFEVRDSIKENKNAVQMAEYEAHVKRENLKLQEIAVTSKIELENAHLQLQAKIDELEIVKHNQTLRAIDEKIAQVLLISNTIDMQPSNKVIPQKERAIGFVANSKEDLVKALFQEGKIVEGDKLTPKAQIVNTRKGDEKIRALYSELQEGGVVEYISSRGYYATANYQTALNSIRA